MMSCAVTGPIPSIVSSCSTVAVPRLIGPSSVDEAPAADRRAARALLWNDDLLPVCQPRRQVDRFQLRLAARPAGPIDRVGHPRPGRQPVDPGPSHRPGHVDDDVGRLAARS